MKKHKLLILENGLNSLEFNGMLLLLLIGVNAIPVLIFIKEIQYDRLNETAHFIGFFMTIILSLIMAVLDVLSIRDLYVMKQNHFIDKLDQRYELKPVAKSKDEIGISWKGGV